MMDHLYPQTAGPLIAVVGGHDGLLAVVVTVIVISRQQSPMKLEMKGDFSQTLGIF